MHCFLKFPFSGNSATMYPVAMVQNQKSNFIPLSSDSNPPANAGGYLQNILRIQPPLPTFNTATLDQATNTTHKRPQWSPNWSASSCPCTISSLTSSHYEDFKTMIKAI